MSTTNASGGTVVTNTYLLQQIQQLQLQFNQLSVSTNNTLSTYASTSNQGAINTLGFTPENISNKSEYAAITTDFTSGAASDIKYPSVKSVYNWVTNYVTTVINNLSLGSAAQHPASYFDLAGTAASALTTAETYASNASNLNSGTINAALLPSSVNSLGSFSTLAALNTANPAASYVGYTAYPVDQGAPFFSDGVAWQPQYNPINSVAQTSTFGIVSGSVSQYTPGASFWTWSPPNNANTIFTAAGRQLTYSGGSLGGAGHMIAGMDYLINNSTDRVKTQIIHESKYQNNVNQIIDYVTFNDYNFVSNIGTIGLCTGSNTHIVSNSGIITELVANNLRIDSNTGTISSMYGSSISIGVNSGTIKYVCGSYLPDLSGYGTIKAKYFNKCDDASSLSITAGPLLETTNDATITTMTNAGAITLPANVNYIYFVLGSAINGQTIHFPDNSTDTDIPLNERQGLEIFITTTQSISNVTWAVGANVSSVSVDYSINRVTSLLPNTQYRFRLCKINNALVWVRAGTESIGYYSFTTMLSINPAVVPLKQVWATTAGQNGTLWVSNGGNWVHESPFVHAADNAGYLLSGVAANSTVYQGNAAFTGTTLSVAGTTVTVVNGGATPIVHNIPSTGYTNFYVYFPGYGSTIPAGWYPGFNYISSNSYSFINTASQLVNAASINAAAAYTSTDTSITFANATQKNSSSGITLPAKIIGNYGGLQVYGNANYNDSPGHKTIKAAINATVFAAITPTGDNQTLFYDFKLNNTGTSGNRLFGMGMASTPYFNSLSAADQSSGIVVDMTTDTVCNLALNIDTVGDYIAIPTFKLIVQNAN